nr:hypothetical protein [Rhodococcus qingshengii]
MSEQLLRLVGAEKVLRQCIRHDEGSAGGKDGVVRTALNFQKDFEKRFLPAVTVIEERLFYVAGCGANYRMNERARMLSQAADVQYSFDPSGDGIPDRCPRTGERLKPFVEMFRSDDVHRLTGL